ncbi:MAG: hypothetical protein IKS49_08020 [Actinomycetaceae bacterium]|nr:hypothetical protein [Actinomycetaceae bacterium]
MTHHLTTRRTLALSCAFTLALSLSACSSQTSSNPTPSPSASPTESFAITATEGIENPDLPERPAEMDNDDKYGAAATAEYFLRLSLYGSATDNWDDYNALSAPDCEFCTSFRDNAHKNQENFSSKTMPEMTVNDIAVGRKEDNPEHWRVNLVAQHGSSMITYKNGKAENVEGVTTGFTFLLDSSNGWKVLTTETFKAELFYELYPEANQ